MNGRANNRTYTVRWERGDGIELRCSGLTARVAFARLMRVLLVGQEPVRVVAVAPDPKESA